MKSTRRKPRIDPGQLKRADDILRRAVRERVRVVRRTPRIRALAQLYNLMTLGAFRDYAGFRRYLGNLS